MLEGHGLALLDRGAPDRIAEALAAIPPQVGAERSLLLALRAGLEANAGHFTNAETLYRSAIDRARTGAERQRLTLRLASILNSLNAVDGSEATIALLEPLCRGIEVDPEVGATAWGQLAVTYVLIGSHEQANAAVAQAFRYVGRSDDVELRARTRQRASFVSYLCGDIRESKRQGEVALQLALDAGMPGLASAALSVLAEVTFADAPDPEPAFRLAERWIGMAQRDGNRGRELGGLCSLHGMRVESGRRAGLTEIEARVAELNDGRFAFGEMSFACKRALAIAIDGDFATAHDLLAGLSMDQLAPAHRGAWLASLALFAAGAGRRAAACGAIDSGLACITDSLAVKPVWQAQSAVFLAAAALVVKRDAIANRVLLALESESRIVPQPARAFVRAVRAMYLCIQTGRGNDTQVRDALEELGRMGRGGLASLLRNLPLPERGEKLALAALTRTELKVLDALARGGTSKSVAAELGRSSQTIDTHVKSIVHKLGCAGRREAIALARAHGLGALGPSNLPRSSV